MKVVYVEETVKTEIAEVTTNQSLTIEQALETAGVTIEDVASKLGCDADEVDYNALQIEA